MNIEYITEITDNYSKEEHIIIKINRTYYLIPYIEKDDFMAKTYKELKVNKSPKLLDRDFNINNKCIIGEHLLYFDKYDDKFSRQYWIMIHLGAGVKGKLKLMEMVS